MENKTRYSNSIIFHWTKNLVGTYGRFSFNILITMLGGTIYSFQLWSSPYILAIFGVLSPLIFTFCLYFIIRIMSERKDNPFPKIFTQYSSNSIIMLFDMSIIIIMAILIHIGTINYLFFRLLQTTFFPLILLLMLRYLYLTLGQSEEDNG